MHEALTFTSQAHAFIQMQCYYSSGIYAWDKGNKGSKMLGLGPNPFSYLLAGLYLPKRSIFKFQWKCRATARKKSPKIMDLGIFRHFNISETILTKLKKIEIFNKIRPFICLYLGTFILFLTIFKKIEENVPISLLYQRKWATIAPFSMKFNESSILC